MTEVQTVQGPIDDGDLGIVLVHEHLRFRDEAVAANWPSRYDIEAEAAAAITAVAAARERGVATIVDPTAMFGGRDVGFLRHVSEATGVRIVPCTGIYTYDFLPPYFENRSEDEIAEHYVEDIERGIQGTDIRAAFIKCAADAPGVNERVEKLHRAAARASLQTGVPIMAHSHPGSGTGPRQVEIFLEEGVDPAKVQLAHTGDSDDLNYIEGLLDRGVWIGLDRFGLNFPLPNRARLETAAELLRRGYARRLLVSQDYCATIDWYTPTAITTMFEQGLVHPRMSMTLVFDEVVPWLRERGVLDDDDLRVIFEENPRAWLTA